jgi:hypothetical protein
VTHTGREVDGATAPINPSQPLQMLSVAVLVIDGLSIFYIRGKCSGFIVLFMEEELGLTYHGQ